MNWCGACRAATRGAFRDIVNRYQSKIYSVIFGILRNQEDAEDVAQQVFAKVYFAIRTFDFRSSLFTWIHRIALNECYAQLRQKRLSLVSQSDLPEDALPNDQPAADRTLAQRDFVNKLLARLPEEDRLLLIWASVEGYSIGEISAMTGLNQSTIKNR